ncbi:MAG: Alvin_2107 family globule sulfur oxidation protein [Gammaproteobacteria bacterium]
MDTTYYEAVSTMERMGVDREYLQGWIGGYLGNPKREPQRLSEAYEAGYEHGRSRTTEHFAQWVRS